MKNNLVQKINNYLDSDNSDLLYLLPIVGGIKAYREYRKSTGIGICDKFLSVAKPVGFEALKTAAVVGTITARGLFTGDLFPSDVYLNYIFDPMVYISAFALEIVDSTHGL